MSQPLLVIFIGVPGSGKTYFASRLAQRIRGVRLGGDAMRLAIFGSLEAITETFHSVHSERVNTYTFGAIDYVTDQLLASGISVVVDAIHSKRRERTKQERVAHTHGARLVLVYIKTPYDTALARGQARDATADHRKFDRDKMKEVIERFTDSLEPPAEDEDVIEISGELPFEAQYASFCEQLEEMTKKPRSQ